MSGCCVYMVGVTRLLCVISRLDCVVFVHDVTSAHLVCCQEDEDRRKGNAQWKQIEQQVEVFLLHWKSRISDRIGERHTALHAR